ncbi:DUF2808 domain-containing protein [Oculatella sp. LEGE 06141]|uniref:DUF2808 domain-containing protein n=1 Tax=Oculatella sp. LEGE 06141 TaxID=1828648 RepID=UPI001880F4D9|nr:DUF2808 domain-containing protein [Oculatella sp. LEGE 06141]MBE9180065.1 DUF2808 domain-containing protein [Oculatella sp. LEGE 06141]
MKISAILTIATTSLLLSSWTIAADRNNSSQSVASSQTLASSTVTSDRSPTNNNTYYLTMTLPTRAATGFAQLSFTERSQDPGAVSIPFDLASTEAFLGTPGANGQAVAIESTWIDETGTFWIEFDPSIAPGTVLTVAFNAKPTPSGSTHEYGIAAYPATARPVAVYVGNGTLNIRR